MLFRLEAETAHRLVLGMLSAWPVIDPPHAPRELRTRALGIEFATPVGLAAGLDKDAVAPGAWQSLGFGFVELGTITPRPQPGNPRPRVWRLPEHRALVNRMGFPSRGMDVVGRRIEELRSRGLRIRLGINLGPNKNTPAERVPDDYAALVARLAPLADFLVVNLSSPNTPGLRAFQSPQRLRESRDALGTPPAAGVPILIKLSPDIADAELGPVCDAIVELGFSGIVATNTTLARAEVGVGATHEGGLSGHPLLGRARSAIRSIRRRVGPSFPIIGVGGIANAADAYGHLRAGANLVELYTGLIYEGPGLVRSINSGLAALLRRDGFGSIDDVIGIDAG